MFIRSPETEQASVADLEERDAADSRRLSGVQALARGHRGL